MTSYRMIEGLDDLSFRDALTPVLGEVLEGVRQLAGGDAVLRGVHRISEGWSAGVERYEWVVRLTLSGAPWPTAILKLDRPRRGRWPGSMDREIASLQLLRQLGCRVAPLPLYASPAGRLVVMEDIGRGAALEDLLRTDDVERASAALVASARALGEAQASTFGHARRFYDLLGGDAATTMVADASTVGTIPLADVQERIEAADPSRPGPTPIPKGVRTELLQLGAELSSPAAIRCFTNGDFQPQNCWTVDGRGRIIDFEGAGFQHPLVDIARLRLGLDGGSEWLQLPPATFRRAEVAYRRALGRAWPLMLDDAAFERELTTAMVLRVLCRLAALSDLVDGDVVHGKGFSLRERLVRSLEAGAKACEGSRYPAIGDWFDVTGRALGEHWSYWAA